MNAELRLAVDQIRLMAPGQVWLLPVRLDDCDLFLNEVRTAAQELRGDARFPAGGGSGPTITTLVGRAHEYEVLVEPLTNAVITLGAWGGEPDATVLTRAMKSLAATTQDLRGGFTAYLTLRTYPLLLLLYAGALGAVARSNGRMLAAFTTDPTVAVEGRALALPVAVTPWRPFADSEAAASVLARVTLEGGTVEQYATDAAQGRGPRYYTPMSEYLFARLRPLAEPFVLDESEYEQLFHRTEALIALAELDWMARNTDAEESQNALLNRACEALKRGDQVAAIHQNGDGTYEVSDVRIPQIFPKKQHSADTVPAHRRALRLVKDEHHPPAPEASTRGPETSSPGSG